MIVQRHAREESAGEDFYATVDETEGTADLCPANISESDDPRHYLSCGRKMKQRDGEMYCTKHGVMH